MVLKWEEGKGRIRGCMVGVGFHVKGAREGVIPLFLYRPLRVVLFFE